MGWFSSSKPEEKKPEVPQNPSQEQERPPFDANALPPRKKLPKSIQQTLENEEKMWEVLVEGEYVL
jgi:fission process protein 1